MIVGVSLTAIHPPTPTYHGFVWASGEVLEFVSNSKGLDIKNRKSWGLVTHLTFIESSIIACQVLA